MALTVRMKLNLPKANEIIRQCGLGAHGDVQLFHTQNVLRRIQKYMPMRTGAFIDTTITSTTETEITSVGPHAAYLYYGKVMVDSETGKGPALIRSVGYRYKKGATLKATDRELQFSKEKNPQAGPYWDRALVASEGDVLVRELQDYINRRKK